MQGWIYILIVENMEGELKLPKVLNVYKDAEFVVKLKARFVYYLIISAMIILGVMIPLMIYLQMSDVFFGGIYLPVLLPMLAALFVFAACYRLLVGGRYLLSANLLLVSSLTMVWLVMFLSNNGGLARLDTVAWLFAILAMAPLLIDQKKGLSLIYTLTNAVILIVFLFFIRRTLVITDYEFNDYLVNTTMAMVFLGIVSYNIYAINKSAIAKIQSDIQKRKESEKALYESEARYRDLFESMPNGFYRSTSEGYFVEANPAFVKMMGYNSLEELKQVYIPTDIYVHESEREEITISSEFSTELVTFRLKRKDGRIIWIEENARFIKDKAGKILYHEGICRDVSDRKEAEDALLESETDLKSIIENSMDSIWSINKDYELKYVNNVFVSEFQNIFGVKLTKGVSLLSAMPQSIRGKWEKRYLQVLSGESMIFEDAVDAGEDKIFIEVSGNPIEMDGKVIGACFFGRNTTEKKHAEEELRQNKEMFETLFDSAPIDISVMDRQGRYMLVNKQVADKLNLPAEFIIGKTSEEIGLHFEEESLLAIEQELMNNGFVRAKELISWHSEGEINYSYYNGNQITINGEACLLNTSLEFTDKKKIEKELEDYKNHLESLIQDRTEELVAANEELKAINEELFDKNHLIGKQKEELEATLESLKSLQLKLIQSEKMASLGILTAGVAHEINNPVNFIANGTAAVESYISDNHQDSLEELTPLFDAIAAGVKRVTGIVRSMSKYNRSETLPASDCNIHEILDDGLTLLYNQYKTRINIIRKYTPEKLLVTGHEGQLHQVFLNVLANAIQAIENEGEVVVQTFKLENRVRIRITDNGTGMTEEQLRHIYDPFYTTKAPGKGTGLGLSISHRIISDHNGTISCESTMYKGSCFTIDLPLIKQEP